MTARRKTAPKRQAAAKVKKPARTRRRAPGEITRDTFPYVPPERLALDEGRGEALRHAAAVSDAINEVLRPRDPVTGEGRGVFNSLARAHIVEMLRNAMAAVLVFRAAPGASGGGAATQSVPPGPVFLPGSHVGFEASAQAIFGAEWGPLMPGDGAYWVRQVLVYGIDAAIEVAADVLEQLDLAAYETNTLSSLAQRLSTAFRREVLRRELARHDFNLTFVSNALHMGGAGNVTKVAEQLGLGPLLREARKAGKARRGRKRGPTSS